MTTTAVSQINANASPSPDNLEVVHYSYLTRRESVLQSPNEPHNIPDSILSVIAINTTPSPDNFSVAHVALVTRINNAATRLIEQNQYGYSSSSQRPQKSTIYFQQGGLPSELEAILMGMNLLGTSTSAPDFASQTLADAGPTVSFSLETAKTVLVVGIAKALVYSDAMAAVAKVGFKHDATDVDVHNYLANPIGSNSYKVGVCFVYPLSLAAGAHTLVLRALTKDGSTAGNLVGPMSLTVIG